MRDKLSIERTNIRANKVWLKWAHKALLKWTLEPLLSHIANGWTPSATQYQELHSKTGGLIAALDQCPQGLIYKNIKINTKILLLERRK